MKPKELKHQLLNDLSQVVIFDKLGAILDSCHTLTDFSALIGKNAYEIFPFLESIQAGLSMLDSKAHSQFFAGVEISEQGLDGDYEF